MESKKCRPECADERIHTFAYVAVVASTDNQFHRWCDTHAIRVHCACWLIPITHPSDVRKLDGLEPTRVLLVELEPLNDVVMHAMGPELVRRYPNGCYDNLDRYNDIRSHPEPVVELPSGLMEQPDIVLDVGADPVLDESVPI